MTRTLEVAASYAASAVRLGAGVRTHALGPRPAEPLRLYEFEGCPFCRKVREALSSLDLEAMVYPCPHGGERHRAEVERKGGRQLFPYLEDPNTGVAMYESDDIVRYLYERYGAGKPPAATRIPPLNDLSSFAATACDPIGTAKRPARVPNQPLELYSFEGSPYCRIVRATLCSLELEYRLHNVAKKSPSRPAFVERSGYMMVPYLVDPNTGRAMFESADIKAYLLETYGV